MFTSDNRKVLATLLGNPPSRKDVETLQTWFRMLLEKVESEELIEEDRIKNKKLIYMAAFQEVVR